MRAIWSVFSTGTLVAAMLMAAQASSASPKDSKPDPVGELKSTIKSGIALLKEKEFKEFLELTMPPDDRERLNKSGHLDEIVKSMSQKPEQVDIAIKLFEGIAGKDPKMNEDNTEATFEAPMIGVRVREKEISFQKIKDRWYIKPDRKAANQ